MSDTETRLGRIEGTLESISKNIAIMSEAVVTLAKVEERVALHHEQHQEGMDRLGGRVDDHEIRLKILEQSDTKQNTKMGFGEQFFWIVIAGVASAMIGYIFGKV